ncbi:hypothetical protein D3C71_1380220 [compost metagenome]
MPRKNDRLACIVTLCRIGCARACSVESASVQDFPGTRTSQFSNLSLLRCRELFRPLLAKLLSLATEVVWPVFVLFH